MSETKQDLDREIAVIRGQLKHAATCNYCAGFRDWRKRTLEATLAAKRREREALR